MFQAANFAAKAGLNLNLNWKQNIVSSNFTALY